MVNSRRTDIQNIGFYLNYLVLSSAFYANTQLLPDFVFYLPASFFMDRTSFLTNPCIGKQIAPIIYAGHFEACSI